MRIAYVITRADEIGGAQVHVRDIATALHQGGHEVTVIAGRGGALSDQLAARGVPFQTVPGLRREIVPWREHVALRQLRVVLRQLWPDLVSTHSSKAGWLGRLAARTLGIPVLFTAHGWAFTDGVSAGSRRFYALAERLAAPLADQIITVSEYDRALALDRRIAAPSSITCIHNGVHECPTAEPRRAPGPPRILMVGRFSPQKDHSGLLQALASLRDLPWVLDLVGDGPLVSSAVGLAEALGIRERVRFLGARDDVPEFLRGADIYALISNWEGLPRSILEAMSAGLPVVASDVGGVSEAVADGFSGFLVARGDARSLAAKLRLLILDESLRTRLGTASRRRYESEFRFEDMLQRTLGLYQRIQAGRGRPAGGSDRPERASTT